MIKNEYMKLSRDASHRKSKSTDQDAVDGTATTDEDGKKVQQYFSFTDRKMYSISTAVFQYSSTITFRKRYSSISVQQYYYFQKSNIVVSQFQTGKGTVLVQQYCRKKSRV